MGLPQSSLFLFAVSRPPGQNLWSTVLGVGWGLLCCSQRDTPAFWAETGRVEAPASACLFWHGVFIRWASWAGNNWCCIIDSGCQLRLKTPPLLRGCGGGEWGQEPTRGCTPGGWDDSGLSSWSNTVSLAQEARTQSYMAMPAAGDNWKENMWEKQFHPHKIKVPYAGDEEDEYYWVSA